MHGASLHEYAPFSAGSRFLPCWPCAFRPLTACLLLPLHSCVQRDEAAGAAAAPPPDHYFQQSGWPTDLAAPAAAGDANPLRIPKITFRPIKPDHTVLAPLAAPTLHISVPSVANSISTAAAAAAAAAAVQAPSPFELTQRQSLQHQQSWQQQQRATVSFVLCK